MISAGTKFAYSLEICSSKLILDLCVVKPLPVNVLFPKLLYGFRLNFVLRFTVLNDYDLHLTFRGPCIVSVFLLIYFQPDATLHTLFISGKLFYVFRVITPPIIRNTHNCIYSIW